MSKKVRKAVIPAAGRATRQYPASAAVPKAMFPLVDRDGLTKPTIQLLIEEAVASGIEEVFLIVRPGEESIYRNYFRRTDEKLLRRYGDKDWAMRQMERLADLGQRLHFAVQESPEGFGHAVYQARRFTGDEPFLLILGDHIFLSDCDEPCGRQVTRVLEEFNLDGVTAVQLTGEDELHLFGTIRGRPTHADRGLYKAELIIEKPGIEVARRELATPGLPDGRYLSHFGMHVFSPRIFESLEYLIRNNIREKNEIQLTAAQEHLRRTTDSYWVAVIRGRRYDTGIPWGLMESQLALAMAGPYRKRYEEAFEQLSR